ncbi:sugar transferase [Bacteriovoracales bacterium]|nr:sugar transferase [Bacteriovoracales bacterium]
MKRAFDFSMALIFSFILGFPFFIIFILIKLTSPGPTLYWSKRVGKDNSFFQMPKFRTMSTSTPQVATHLLGNSENYLTPLGKVLRKTSLDEIPQLWSILKGDMSFVGPRPALYNQGDLVKLRTSSNVEKLLPGLTGWAQINGRDEISIPEKVKLDVFYYQNKSFWFDLKILFLTVLRVIFQRDISH